MDLTGLLGTPFADLHAQAELSGHLTSPVRIEGRTHVGAPSIGIGFVDHGDGLVGTIHVHCDATEGMDRFAGELPHGLSRTMPQVEVRRLLGEPESSKAGLTLPVLGAMPPWDRFVVGECVVHVSYRADEQGLSLVTLMSREVAPDASGVRPSARARPRFHSSQS